MATDNTPPRLRLIVTIAVVVIIALFSLDFVFKSYFAFMTDEAKHEKTAPKTELLAQLVLEREALAGSKLPLDQAMSQVGKGMRPDLIDPKPSDDVAAMTGWNKLPKQAPLPAPMNDLRPAMGGDGGAWPHPGDPGPPVDGGAAAHPAAADGGPSNHPSAAGAHPVH